MISCPVASIAHTGAGLFTPWARVQISLVKPAPTLVKKYTQPMLLDMI